MIRRVLASLVLALFLVPPAAAQESTPIAASAAPLDLAAMALAPEDVPGGFFDDYSEWLVPAGAMTALAGAPPPAGFERLYQTFYVSLDEPVTIHVFLMEFASAAQANAGAGYLDALLRPPLPEGTTTGPDHASGPVIGHEASTLTFVSYDTWSAGGPRADVVAASFSHDRLIAGISIERYTDPPADGTPIADVATPTADPSQEQLAVTLATALDQRIGGVLAGKTPLGVDVALAASLLPLEQLVSASTPVFGGYKNPLDLLRCGVCGEDNSLAPLASPATSGVVRGVVVGPLVDGEPQPPFVSIAITSFATSNDALAVLAAIRLAPNDRPTAIPVPRGLKTLVADPAISGASEALAFTAVLDEENADAPPDSAGVDLVVGNLLVTIDVQGGLSAEDALAAAIDFATQQTACLTAGGPCESVTRPAALGSS
jgi:hypothetical protein